MLHCLKTQVRFPVGCWDKRFVRNLSTNLTENGAVQLRRVFRRYRRQIQHPDKPRLLLLCELP